MLIKLCDGSWIDHADICGIDVEPCRLGQPQVVIERRGLAPRALACASDDAAMRFAAELAAMVMAIRAAKAKLVEG